MIYLAADAKSQELKSWIIAYLEEHNHKYTDIGPKTQQDKSDITDFVPLVARKIIQSENTAENTAIVVCGNGTGATICMNRYKGIRAAPGITPKMAEWGKLYDNCNALCLAAWNFDDSKKLNSVLKAWFGASFDPIPRRLARLEAMDELGP